MNDRLGRTSYSAMRRMYEQDGLTYRQIADKLKLEHFTTGYVFLRREAKRRGDPWPLVRPKKVAPRPGTVDAKLVAMEIREFVETSGWTYLEFAKRVGVHRSWVYNIVAPNPPRTRIRRSSAQKVMRFIESFADEEAAA